MQSYKKSRLLPMIIGSMFMNLDHARRTYEPQPILHKPQVALIKYQAPVESKRKQRKRKGKKKK